MRPFRSGEIAVCIGQYVSRFSMVSGADARTVGDLACPPDRRRRGDPPASGPRRRCSRERVGDRPAVVADVDDVAPRSRPCWRDADVDGGHAEERALADARRSSCRRGASRCTSSRRKSSGDMFLKKWRLAGCSRLAEHADAVRGAVRSGVDVGPEPQRRQPRRRAPRSSVSSTCGARSLVLGRHRVLHHHEVAARRGRRAAPTPP